MKKLTVLLAVVLFACEDTKENSSEWIGEWKATWETDPALYVGMNEFTHFTMPGKFTFTKDSITIEAFGFEGCVFGQENLKHSLTWKVSGDSLILINSENAPGMVYLVKEVSSEKIRLQLMDDIFLTLNK